MLPRFVAVGTFPHKNPDLNDERRRGLRGGRPKTPDPKAAGVEDPEGHPTNTTTVPRRQRGLSSAERTSLRATTGDDAASPWT
jgi:hypothetical protein